MASTPYQTTDVLDTVLAPNPTVGATAADYLGFYGGAGAPQASGPNQAALPLVGQVGNILTNSLSVAPGATITLNTVLARAVTLSTPGPLATDFALPINKLTSQAGLAVFSSRMAAANSLEVTFGNNTGSSVQPATEVCQYTTVSTPLCLAATLTPASVAANTTVEQIFTVTGVLPGQIVFVNKPTTQTGLGIQNCRVVANNQVAIAFVNLTAAPIVPTAAEAYTFFATSGISSISPLMTVGVTAATTSITTITSTENTMACAQILADDAILGASKPTLDAGIVMGTSRATAGNILTQYVNPTAGGVAPTAQILQYEVVRHNQLGPVAVQTAALIPISVAANTSAEQTFTVANLITGTFVGINKPTLTPGLVMGGVRVSGTNTLAITFMNITGSAIVPPAEVYTILYSSNIALTGTSWIKFFGSQLQTGVVNLLTAIRSMLVNTGFMPGA